MKITYFLGGAAALALIIMVSQSLTPSNAEETNVEKTETTISKDDIDTSHLTEEQKYVTVHDGTEPPFKNKYWDNHEPGIYVDVVTGEPLFSSTDKFDSGTGWPSFTKPITEHNVQTKPDYKLGLARTEVRSSKGDFHLGHLFDDGPREFGGQRYCINSASLRFVPVDDMAAEGYDEYLVLFSNQEK